MKKKTMFVVLSAVVALFIYSAAAFSDEMKPVKLLPPQTEGGKPLMQTLKDRKSVRAFQLKDLPPQILSNLLWAACGVNRPGSGGRTRAYSKEYAGDRRLRCYSTGRLPVRCQGEHIGAGFGR